MRPDMESKLVLKSITVDTPTNKNPATVHATYFVLYKDRVVNTVALEATLDARAYNSLVPPILDAAKES